MIRKPTIVALTAIVGLLLALPAIASAGVWHQVPASNFTIAGGVFKDTTTSGGVTTCHNVTGTGAYNAGSTTEGTLSLKFHGCSASSSPTAIPTCTGSGQPSGTVATTTLGFSNILIDAGTPGILITPAGSGHFFTYTCFGITSVFSGNGVIGHLNRACGTTNTTAVLSFESSSAGHQKFKQITTTGTIYDLTASKGGSLTTASWDSSMTITSAVSGKVECTA